MTGSGDHVEGHEPHQPDPDLASILQRLEADGCRISSVSVAGRSAVLGHREDFRLRWYACRLHLLTFLARETHVARADLEQFTEQIFDIATDLAPSLRRGPVTNLAVLPALVGDEVDPDAVAWAVARQRHRGPTIARPVVVDAVSGRSHWSTDEPMIGGVYAAHVAAKATAYFGPSA